MMLNNLKKEAIELLNKIDDINISLVELMNEVEYNLKNESDENMIKDYTEFLTELKNARNLNIYESVYRVK